MKIKQKITKWKEDHVEEITAAIGYGCAVAVFVGGLCLWAHGVNTGSKAKEAANYNAIKTAEKLHLIKCFDVDGNPTTYDKLVDFVKDI